MNVYLDNCCYNRPYDDQSNLKISLETQAKLRIQKMISDGELSLVASYVLITENYKNPADSKRKVIREFVMKNASVYVSKMRRPQIEDLASDIMNTGIKYMDACHLASAIYARCDYFISTDKRLLKYQTDRIKLVTPIEFIESWEDTDYGKQN